MGPVQQEEQRGKTPYERGNWAGGDCSIPKPFCFGHDSKLCPAYSTLPTAPTHMYKAYRRKMWGSTSTVKCNILLCSTDETTDASYKQWW